MQSEGLRQHASTTLHKVAMASLLAPDRPLTYVLHEGCSDEQLLRGRVPQLQHWLRVWRFCKTPTSHRAAECLQQTEEYICTARCPDETVAVAKRGALARMATIIAEVVRETKRAILRGAMAICLSLDDRDAHRVIRFQCVSSVSGEVVPMAAACSLLVSGTTNVYSGLLCVQRRNGSASSETLNTLDEDYSVRMSNGVLAAIDKFCTPLNGQLDADLRAHILRRTWTYTSDGATTAVKCGRLLGFNGLSNLRLLIRDVAHSMRTSCQVSSRPHRRGARFP